MRQWAWRVRPAAPCVRENHSQAHLFQMVKKAEKCYKNNTYTLSDIRPYASRQKCRVEARATRRSTVHGRLPNCQAESNLVDEIRKVVDQVQDIVVDSTHQVAEEIAQWIDGPADADNQAHCRVRLHHILVYFAAICRHLASFSRKGFEQDESPSTHAHNESRHGWNELSLTSVTECKHKTGPKQEPPEHAPM